MTEPLKDELLGELLGLLAHDLRNPLSALQSNLSFLLPEDEPADSEQREAFDDALASCDALANLIDNVELVSQRLAPEAPKPRQELVVAAVVRDVLQRHRGVARSHSVGLEADPSAEDITLRVRTRPVPFARALANLLRNGIQHSRQDQSVRVLGWRQGDRGGVVVADSGPRLGAEFAQLAFRPEGQAACKEKSEGRYGRGLGLFSAQLAARMAEATIACVDPPPGARNAFLLSAPVAADE